MLYYCYDSVTNVIHLIVITVIIYTTFYILDKNANAKL